MIALVGLYDLFVSQVAPANWRDNVGLDAPRVADVFPWLPSWTWLLLVIVLLLFFGLEGAYRYLQILTAGVEAGEPLGVIRHSRVRWVGRREPDGSISVGGPYCLRCPNPLGLGYDSPLDGGSTIATDADHIRNYGSPFLLCWNCRERYWFDRPATVGQTRDEARTIFGPDHLDAPHPEEESIPITWRGYSSSNGRSAIDGGEYFVSRPVTLHAAADLELFASLEVRLKDNVNGGVIELTPLRELSHEWRGDDVDAPLFENGMKATAGEVRSVVFAFRIEPTDAASFQAIVGDPKTTSYRGDGVTFQISDAVSGRAVVMPFGSEYPRAALSRALNVTPL